MRMVRSGYGAKQGGSSLIEILVVIVIFTVGILAAIQIFPGGLTILKANRSNTVANALARAEMERQKAENDQLPDGIFSSTYPAIGPTIRELEIDLQRRPTDISPPPQITGMDNAGQLFDADGGLGAWQLFSGANSTRQVIGEGRRIPAARFVDGPGGTRYGGVLNLQYAPLFLEINLNDPDLGQIPFIIYGNDLLRRITDADLSGGFRLRQDYVTFVEDDGEFMTIPQGPYRPDLPDGALSRSYRVSARVLFTDGGGALVAQDLIRVVRVSAALPGQRRLNVPFDLRALFNDPSGVLTTVRVEPDTLQVARLFEEVGAFLTEAQIGASRNILDDAVYQYQRLNDRLGSFLFHPQGAQYVENRAQGRVPLRARVDYNVLDWRNIRDDFRVPNNAPFQQKLIVDSIKVGGNRGIDGRTYLGLGFTVPNGTGGQVEQDFLLVDRETGATVLPNSYTIDKSGSVLTFLDVDGNPANGLTADLVFAGTNATNRVADIRNRSFRAIYQANGEFAVQPVKSFSRYRPTFSSTLGVGQTYVGGTDINAPASLPTRLYFPLSDIGKKIVVGEIWYRNAANTLLNLTEQEFIIRAPGPTDWNRYAYIDIRERDPNAQSFDFSFAYGYVTRNVRGASIGVRVFWNASSFSLDADPGENMRRLGEYLSQTRRITTETFLMKQVEE